MDIRSSLLATQGYAQTKAVAPASQESNEASKAMKSAQSFIETMRENEAVVTENLITGADPHALVQAIAETELAVETAVTVRNKVVEAYQEILRMPV
ncbi:flagellar hook-basal body complex protein FliE [Tropicimonas sp. S265A]|uniref:flagellar hook-basal body complex protein FliE n=1 Tax=Tropicimonas sp. S265A TaxID=3415134 RepID=UPI003C7EC5F2